MNKIFDAIKCVNCRNELDASVTLPCGCSICLKHTHDAKETILCCNCEIDHPLTTSYGPFRPNTALTHIINAQINNIDKLFNQELKGAKRSCSRLDELLVDIEHVLNDPFNFIYEAVEYLKHVTQVQVEERKLKIGKDEIAKLDVFKTNCKSNLKSFLYLATSAELKRKKENCRQELDKWMATLNVVKQDEPEWKRIMFESAKVGEMLKTELEKFKRDILLQKRFEAH
jgi:hypothetical protein